MFKREQYIERISFGFEAVPIVVLIGARQVGKTSLMQMYPTEGDKLFINGQDPETALIFLQFSQLEQYLKVYLNETISGHLLIDEFQFIHGISTMLKLLTDKYSNLKVLCSGSSSIGILQEVEESLAGRLRTIEVYPLSFSEYLMFQDEKLYRLFLSLSPLTPASPLDHQFEHLLEEYILFGGLPRAAIAKDRKQKLAILEDIYKTYLMHDVRSFIRNEHMTGFNKLLRMLSAQVGNLLNINELSRETGLTYRLCEDYIELLQQMYIIRLAEPFSSNIRSTISKMKKIYFCDSGLRNMIQGDFTEMQFRADNGALFENYVLMELSRKLMPGGSVRYFRTTNGTEVDFVVNQLVERIAIECKYKKMGDKPAHSRALHQFLKTEGAGKSVIVTRDLNGFDKDVQFIKGFQLCQIRM